MRPAIAVLTLWVVFSVALPLQASTTGGITGRIVDESGGAVADARVSFVSSALQGERVIHTDSEGRFLTALLPVGPYAVSVASPGKQTVTISLRVTVGGTEPLLIKLLPGDALRETVVVDGTATKLETTVIGESFNYSRRVEELPIHSRSVETVARLAPNVTNTDNESDPAQRFVSISGGARLENATLLDGAELTDQLGFITRELFLEDSIEELQVLTAGVSSRYGRFAGGVLNAITKSGGNTFDGTVRAEFSKESWNAQTPLDEPQDDTLNQVYQGTLGGYILKDKLWFFVGGRTIPAETMSGRTVLTGEAYTEELTEDRWQIKLRGAPAANHTIELSYLDFDLKIDGGQAGQAVFPGDLQAASTRGRFPGDLSTLTYQGVLGDATFLEAVASERNVRSSRGGTPELGAPIWDAVDDVFYNSVWSAPSDPIDRDNEALSANVTHVFSTKNRGTHTLESGVQYTKTIVGGANVWSATGLFWAHFDNGAAFPFAELGAGPGEVVFNVNASDQENVRYEDLPLGGRQEIDNIALYLHDSWRMGKWRVDAGLRWERYRGTAPSGSDLGIDADGLAPRLGLTYNVRSDLQLQAFWGKYIARLDDEFITRNTGVGFFPSIGRLYIGPEVLGATAAQLEQLLLDDANWGALVELADADNPTSFIAPDLELPYARDINLSARYGLPRSSGSITLSFIDREFRNLLEPQVGDFGTATVPAPDGPETVVVDRVVLDNVAEGERTYQAIAATWDYRPGARWDIGGSYTWSETRGNQEEDFSRIGSALGSYERSRPEAAAVPTGFLFWDRTNLFRFWGNYRFDLGRPGVLALGGIARYESGAPWSRRARVAYSDDPAYLNDTTSRYWHYFDGRGSNRFDAWWSLDLSARYGFDIAGGVSAWVKASVINVFNNDTQFAFNTSGRATTTPPASCPGCVTDSVNGLTWVPGSSFGESRSPFDYQQPRSFLFTLGVAF